MDWLRDSCVLGYHVLEQQRLGAWDIPTSKFGFFFTSHSKKPLACTPKGVSENSIYPSVQWEFQDPKMEVLYHIRPIYCKAYVRGYPHKIWPYTVQYLHFRILKFPLISYGKEEIGNRIHQADFTRSTGPRDVRSGLSNVGSFPGAPLGSSICQRCPLLLGGFKHCLFSIWLWINTY